MRLAPINRTHFDFPDGCADIVSKAYASGKVVGAVCHGPMGLVKAMDGDKPLVAGKKVAAFTDVAACGMVLSAPPGRRRQLREMHPSVAAVRQLGAMPIPSCW